MSDFVRLGLLQVYGGFWIDTTVVVNSNLKDYRRLLQEHQKDVIVYFAWAGVHLWYIMLSCPNGIPQTAQNGIILLCGYKT